MMLCLVPPWIEPTVTTAGSVGSISRLTMVCRSTMTKAARTIGSTVRCGQAPRGADEAGHVDVVAAGVHHADRSARRIGRLRPAGVRNPRGLDHGKRVHVGAHQDDGSRAVLQDPDDPELAHARRDLGPG